MGSSLLIRAGTIVTPTTMFRGSVSIEGGKIKAVDSESSVPKADRVIDAEGLFVLPGIVDAHVHFREPGLEYKEDFQSGSYAAAAGGVTTVCDMPNVAPPTADEDSFKLKFDRAKQKCIVDYGIFGVVIPTNLDKIPNLAKCGVIGYKIFMGETVGNLPTPDNWELVIAFREITKTGLRVGVHAEDRSITSHLVNQFRSEGRTDAMAHLESRPSIAEAEAIERAITLARPFGTPLHIFHMSSKEGMEIVRKAKAEGLPVTAETCPHYLILDGEEIIRKWGGVAKINPPVRTLDHAKALWDGLKSRAVKMIASDHSPHAHEEKLRDDIWNTPAGWPGVETMLGLMLDQVNKGNARLEQIALWMSEEPAKVWQMYPRKGSLQVDSDADVTIVDMKQEWRIRGNELHSKNHLTPWEGRLLKGKPVYTISRGDVVMEKGQITAGSHRGLLVTPITHH